MHLRERNRLTMNARRNVSYQDYLLESLKDPQEAAAYMDAALEL